MFVRIENGIPVEWPVPEFMIRNANPNASLPNPLTPEVAATLGYGRFVFNGYPSDYNPTWETIEEISPVLVDGVYQQTYKTTERYTPEERARLEQELAKADNKAGALQRLQATDWVELGDVANPAHNPYLVNKDAFTAYRVQLRAIAVNPPVAVDPWPVKPEEVWEGVIPTLEEGLAETE